MDVNTTYKEIFDGLLAEIEPSTFYETISKELVARTNRFEDAFLTGMSCEYFDDSLLDIPEETFEDISKTFSNIRDYIRLESGKEEFINNIACDVEQHLTQHAINLIKVGIRKEEEMNIKSTTIELSSLGASQLHL